MPTQQGAWLSVDAGTSLVKAVLLSPDGCQLASARIAIPILRPAPGHAEQDMRAVWAAVVTVCREALARYKGQVLGVVTTAQGDGVWLMDACGEPAANASLWNDGRAAEGLHPEWIGKAFAVSGSVAYAGLPSAILPWLRTHRPETLQKARWMLTANGWLHFKLTGAALADRSDASNPFGDLRLGAVEYSEELLALYGISDLHYLLPAICPDFTPLGSLQAAAARALGLTAGLPVVMAPYDIASAAAGCGTVEPGEGCLILGTTICAEVIASSPGLDRVPAGTTLALPDGLYMRAMPTLTGCEALDWAMRLLGLTAHEDFDGLAASVPPGSGNLAFLPYLSPAGERAPFLDAAAKGSFLGLDLQHGRAHLARAVLEGLSFAVCDCLEAALGKSPARLAVCGGGARSSLWCQMIADVCGCAVMRGRAAETGTQGALAYALAATGQAASLAQAVRALLGEAQHFFPDRERHDSYQQLFRRFQQLRKEAAASWALMKGTA